MKNETKHPNNKPTGIPPHFFRDGPAGGPRGAGALGRRPGRAEGAQRFRSEGARSTISLRYLRDPRHLRDLPAGDELGLRVSVAWGVIHLP